MLLRNWIIDRNNNSPVLRATTLRVAFSQHGWGKFTLRASEGKFGAFVTEFENEWIQWNSGRVEGKMGRENILLVKVSGLLPRYSYSGRQSRPQFCEVYKVFSIHILHFTDLNSIRPIYYDKTYHAVPEAGGDKAFELLRKAMKDENKVAIAKTVMGTKEKLLTLIPTDDGILIETMFFADEVKQAPKEPAHPEVNEAELTMAKTLINTMVKDFEPSLYKDEYQVKLREIIEQKISGKDVTVSSPDVQVNVIDIMEALKQSLAQAGIKNG